MTCNCVGVHCLGPAGHGTTVSQGAYMRRRLLTILVLAAVARAQEQVPGIPETQPVEPDTTVANQSTIEIFPQYLTLRRGTEEKVVVVSDLNPKSQSSIDTYWVAPSPNNGTLAATELTIHPAEGLAIRAIEYPKSRKRSLAPGADPMRVLGPGFIELHFKLKADRGVALGDHLVTGKVRFQRITKVGNSPPLEQEFSIPIRVVDASVKPKSNSLYREEIPLVEKIGVVMLVILCPFLLPDC
jgi:hypothetical protein